jgi:hypothetical protein
MAGSASEAVGNKAISMQSAKCNTSPYSDILGQQKVETQIANMLRAAKGTFNQGLNQFTNVGNVPHYGSEYGFAAGHVGGQLAVSGLTTSYLEQGIRGSDWVPTILAVPGLSTAPDLTLIHSHQSLNAAAGLSGIPGDMGIRYNVVAVDPNRNGTRYCK